MKTRQDLQNDIKAAKAAKKNKLDARNFQLRQVKAARAAYRLVTGELEAAKAALVAFDKGERPASSPKPEGAK